MVGEALLTACHVLNRVPNKNKEKTPYEEWAITFVFAHLGMLGKGQHSHPKETQTQTKDVAPYLLLKAELLCYCANPWISR
jgi:hypothetical protein